MNNYKVYIHGRPQGQDVWPSYENNIDQFYIEPFLDSKIGSEIDVSLITDLYQGSSYYTYILRKNVIEKVARGQVGSSYFALTVRFDNAICQNVSTLFKLLNQVFEQKCIGSIIQKEKDIKHFLISRFEENPSAIKQIVSIIEQNIEGVLSPYIVPLEKAIDTKDMEPQDCSLSDVDSPSFIADMKKHKLLISPDKKSKAEMCQDLSHQVNLISEKYNGLNSELATVKQTVSSLKESNGFLQTRIQELEGEKRQIQEDLAEATSKIAVEYKQQLKVKEAQIKQAQEELQRQNNLLVTAQEKIVKLEGELKSIKQDKEILHSFTQIKDPLISFARQVASRFPEGADNHSQSSSKNDKGNCKSLYKNSDVSGKKNDKSGKKSVEYNKIKNWLSVGSFVLLLALLALNVYSYLHPLNNSFDTTPLEEKIDSLKSENQQLRDSLERASEDHAVSNPPEKDYKEETVKINIGGYSGAKDSLIQGEQYTLSVNKQTSGAKFVVTGGQLKNNINFTVNQGAKKVTISYVKNGKTIAKREVPAKSNSLKDAEKEDSLQVGQ